MLVLSSKLLLALCLALQLVFELGVDRSEPVDLGLMNLQPCPQVLLSSTSPALLCCSPALMPS